MRQKLSQLYSKVSDIKQLQHVFINDNLTGFTGLHIYFKGNVLCVCHRDFSLNIAPFPHYLVKFEHPTIQPAKMTTIVAKMPVN